MSGELLKKLARITILAFVAGCVENSSPDSLEEPREILHLAVNAEGFYSDRSCDPTWGYKGPSQGSEFYYKLLDKDGKLIDGVTRKETITNNIGSTVEYREILQIPGGGDSPPEIRRIRSGVLPLSGPGMAITYLDDAQVMSLRPSQKTTLPIHYTALGDLDEKRVTTQINVEFIGCKTIVQGRGIVSGEPVRVYRLIVPTLQAPPATNGLTATELEWAISERTGWRLVERSPTASTIVVEMS